MTFGVSPVRTVRSLALSHVVPAILGVLALGLGCAPPGSTKSAPPAASNETPSGGGTPTSDSVGSQGTGRSVPLTSDEAIGEAIRAPGRSEADRALDAGRHPAEMLSFFQIGPGQRVAELAAGGGYTAELVRRVVGAEGVVYGQNSPFLLERFAEKPWSERLSLPQMQGVVRVDSEFDAPLPTEVKDLDAVLFILFYHDTVWMKTDRAKMNASIFRALRPGGIYGVVDHSARSGVGLEDVETLHRIEKSIVIHEVQEAGFLLEAEADFLQNAADSRDWSASPRTAGEKRGTSDRFALRFRKPDSVNCSEPRVTQCSEYDAPVCGLVDTGIRCIRAPCPSSEKRTFLNACQACKDASVMSFTAGTCEP